MGIFYAWKDNKPSPTANVLSTGNQSLSRADGAMLGIEVKAGSSLSKDDFKHLKWFAANLAKERQFTGIVLYSGEHTLRFGEGFYAVPLAALGA